MQSSETRLFESAKRTFRAEVTLVLVVCVVSAWSVYGLYKFSASAASQPAPAQQLTQTNQQPLTATSDLVDAAARLARSHAAQTPTQQHSDPSLQNNQQASLVLHQQPTLANYLGYHSPAHAQLDAFGRLSPRVPTAVGAIPQLLAAQAAQHQQQALASSLQTLVPKQQQHPSLGQWQQQLLHARANAQSRIASQPSPPPAPQRQQSIQVSLPEFVQLSSTVAAANRQRLEALERERRLKAKLAERSLAAAEADLESSPPPPPLQDETDAGDEVVENAEGSGGSSGVGGGDDVGGGSEAGREAGSEGADGDGQSPASEAEPELLDYALAQDNQDSGEPQDQSVDDGDNSATNSTDSDDRDGSDGGVSQAGAGEESVASPVQRDMATNRNLSASARNNLVKFDDNATLPAAQGSSSVAKPTRAVSTKLEQQQQQSVVGWRPTMSGHSIEKTSTHGRDVLGVKGLAPTIIFDDDAPRRTKFVVRVRRSPVSNKSTNFGTDERKNQKYSKDYIGDNDTTIKAIRTPQDLDSFLFDNLPIDEAIREGRVKFSKQLQKAPSGALPKLESKRTMRHSFEIDLSPDSSQLNETRDTSDNIGDGLDVSSFNGVNNNNENDDDDDELHENDYLSNSSRAKSTANNLTNAIATINDTSTVNSADNDATTALQSRQDNQLDPTPLGSAQDLVINQLLMQQQQQQQQQQMLEDATLNPIDPIQANPSPTQVPIMQQLPSTSASLPPPPSYFDGSTLQSNGVTGSPPATSQNYDQQLDPTQAANSLFTVDHGLLLHQTGAETGGDSFAGHKSSKHKKMKKMTKKMTKKYKKGGEKHKKIKKDLKKMKKEKAMKSIVKGKKIEKANKKKGKKSGSKKYVDKGYKKHGFKKEFHRVESGKDHKYFDEFRDKDFKKKYEAGESKYKKHKMKKYAGKDVKKAKKAKEHSESYKKFDKGRWKKKYSQNMDKKKKSSKDEF